MSIFADLLASRSVLRIKKRSHIFASGILFLLSLVSCHLSYAQGTSATLSGTILDQSGAVVSDVEVTVTNADTNTMVVAKTNREGIYNVENLRPGRYRVAVMKPGFKQITVTDITLNIQDTVSRNFRLQIGAASEVITVNAGGQININTTDGAVSTLVDQSYVANMPLNGRSFQDLILLTPGVVTDSPQSHANMGSSGEFSVNGQRTESNYYTVDGVSANIGASLGGATAAPLQQMAFGGTTAASTALGTTQSLVSVDDLQEFRVQSSTYSAEFGRSPGGQFAFETKSGTNQWHGTVFDYLRNSALDANTWFNDYLNVPKGELRQNDFGGALGGPIRIPHVYNGKDKMFFFVNYEGLRLQQPQEASTFAVPDNCMRGVAGACAGLIGPTGQPRTEAENPGLLSVIQAFPAPNRGELDPVNGVAAYAAGSSGPSSINSTNIRFDQVVNDKMTLFFRFSDTSSNMQLNYLPSVLETTPFLSRTYTAGADNTLSNRLSNDFRFNYSTNMVTSSLALTSVGGNVLTNLASLDGIPTGGTSVETYLFRLGTNSLSLGASSPVTNQQTQWNAVDTVSYSVGAHQFKFGVDYRRLAPALEGVNTGATYQFTSEPFVESGVIARGQIIRQNNAYPLFTNFSAFAQDDWKASHRLTLSFGLRWEVNPPPSAAQGTYPYTIAGTGIANFALAPAGTPEYNTTWFNFAPRFGVAYVLRNTPGWETVVRGGAGVFFDTGQQLDSVSFFGPGFSGVGLVSGVKFPNTPLTLPTVSASGFQQGGLLGYDPHLQLPYTLQWNVSVQQSVGKSQAITASYVGAHGARLLQENEFMTSPPPAIQNPNAAGFTLIQNGLTSDYDALQLQYQRRLSRGLTVLGSYGWSHCIDYGSVNATVQYQRGDCDFDVRQNLSAALSYNLPNAGENSLIKAILDHWGVDDRFTIRTAMPVFLTGNPTLNVATGQQMAQAYNVVQGVPTYIYGSACASYFTPVFNALHVKDVCPGGRAINPCAFVTIGSAPTPTCAGLYPTGVVGGQAPRNAQRGFDAVQMDMAIRREFPIHENLKLQFRAEAFNVFNHPNFGTVNTQGTEFGLTTATLAKSLGILGQQYQMGGPRSMQFALKLIF